MLLLAHVAACGGDAGSGVTVPGPPGGSVEAGRIALTWVFHDAPLTAALCAEQGIQYMQVDLERPDGSGQEYTEVTCALDRYSLANTPLGLVQVVVTGVSQDGQELCAHLQGQTMLTVGTVYPSTPARIVLLPASGCLSP